MLHYFQDTITTVNMIVRRAFDLTPSFALSESGLLLGSTTHQQLGMSMSVFEFEFHRV